MVSVKLWGGIGNQMFQFAFATYMSKERNDSISFFSDLKSEKLGDLAIKNFKLDLVEISKHRRKDIKYYFKSNLEYRIKRKIIQLFPFVNKNVLVEKGLHFKSNIAQRYILFDGYWQSYKYANNVESELREKFIFNDNSLIELDAYKYILETNSVSVHIRKGDYLKGKNVLIFEECTLEYYNEAIDLISKNIESPVFFVFSNDMKWAKDNFKVSKKTKIHFVDNSNNINSAIADMFLMSKCKNNIIANSTFSWWAAWLNSYKNKIIIAPKKWYVGELNEVTDDLIPPDWYRL